MDRVEIQDELLFPRLVADRSHAIYQRDLGRHMQGASGAASLPLVQLNMMEDIALNFVLDGEAAFHLLRETDRVDDPKWTDIALISKAFLNLRDQHGEFIKLQQLENGLFRINSPGKYDASFLLLGNLWTRLEDQLGTNFFAAVPSHDILLVARQDDRLGILHLQELVRETFYEAPAPLLLSKAIYQRWDEQWQITATAF